MNKTSFIILFFAAITGTTFVLAQIAYASSTHMTLHNLTNETAELWVELPADSPHCIAQPNSTCEAGTELIWYTVDVDIPNSQNPTWEKTLTGVYGHCDIYVKGSPGTYDATHHCSLAEKAGLKPPANNSTN